MRLTLVIASLGTGGAERVLSSLANHAAERGHDVAIVTLDDGATPPFFPLDPRVRRRPIGGPPAASLPARARNLAARVWRLRRAVAAERPDVAVAFMDRTNLLALAATLGQRTPVVVAERNDPAQHDATRGLALLRRLLYRRARAVVVQTAGAAAYFRGPLAAKTVVVPNPVFPPPATAPAARTGREVVAMGRLSPEKGFDLLLDAFARVAPRFPDWRLTIWGDGPLRAQLEAQRDAFGLAGRVHLPGRTTTPAAEMARADCFVLSSRYEGFPNVLAEAMAAGTAVVSADCPSGPRDMVTHDKNGLLVPPGDADALAAAMARLMGDPAERARLGTAARAITDVFAPARVFAMWDTLIATHATPKGSAHVRHHRPAERPR